MQSPSRRPRVRAGIRIPSTLAAPSWPALDRVNRGQLEREVASGVRSALPAGFIFVGVAMSTLSRRGPRLDRLLEDVAAHGARHTVGLPDEKGATMQALLRTRFRARMGLGLHDNLMQAYLRRAQELQRGWEARTGLSAVTGLELRFQ